MYYLEKLYCYDSYKTEKRLFTVKREKYVYIHKVDKYPEKLRRRVVMVEYPNRYPASPTA